MVTANNITALSHQASADQGYLYYYLGGATFISNYVPFIALLNQAIVFTDAIQAVFIDGACAH